MMTLRFSRTQIFCLLGGVVLIGWAFTRTVQAQDNTPTSAAAVQDYLQKVDTYRRVEATYFDARQQYLQLLTLASLEDAVTQAKAAQLSRVDTLISYFNAILLTLQETNGLEIGIKNQQVQQLQNILLTLRAQRLDMEKATDRLGLDATNATFKSQQDTYIHTAYNALSYIKVARVQSGVDHLGVAAQAAYDDVQSRNLPAAQAAEKQRAYDELVRLIQQLKDNLATIHADQANQLNRGFTADVYTGLLSSLSKTYSGLSRGASFVQEIMK